MSHLSSCQGERIPEGRRGPQEGAGRDRGAQVRHLRRPRAVGPRPGVPAETAGARETVPAGPRQTGQLRVALGLPAARLAPLQLRQLSHHARPRLSRPVPGHRGPAPGRPRGQRQSGQFPGDSGGAARPDPGPGRPGPHHHPQNQGGDQAEKASRGGHFQPGG